VGDIIDKTYLPFTEENLRQHFIVDIDGQLEYYRKSAKRYHEFIDSHTVTAGVPLRQSKTPRQIEKDERFWTVTAIKHVFDDPSRESMFGQLLSETYGASPPINGIGSWDQCLKGHLRLYFEACLPSPATYVDWLRSNLQQRQMIPYVLDAARRENARPLEGATHVDALLLNVTNGFAWLIEAKVLSDVSYLISFDSFRNQIARNIDVMLDNTSSPGDGLEKRKPDRTLFGLLTPAMFREYPSSRLYGWLMEEYRTKPEALRRDLSHRSDVDWTALSRRIGWITFEDFESVRKGTCPWFEGSEGPYLAN